MTSLIKDIMNHGDLTIEDATVVANRLAAAEMVYTTGDWTTVPAEFLQFHTIRNILKTGKVW